MKIYIAGPITKVPFDETAIKFIFAAGVIESKGHTALNPLEMVDQTAGRKYGEYLADALQIMLTQADAVYFMPGWSESDGATIEHSICLQLEMTYYINLQNIPQAEEG